MRLLFLFTPVLMLAALWALQRLEAWMSHPLGPGTRGSAGRVDRHTGRRSRQRRQTGIDHA